MEVSYNFIKNDNTAQFHWANLWLSLPVCVKEKIREKEREEKNVIAVARSCKFQIMSKKACHGIRCVSVLKSSARKFSEDEPDCCCSV